MGKKSGSDSGRKAAETQGRYAQDTARDQNYADRANQYNPFGSIEYGQELGIDPATGKKITKWTQNQTLSPEMQRLYDSTTGQMGDRADLARDVFGRVQGEMGGAPDWAQFGEQTGMEYDPTQIRQRAEDAAYGRATSRLDPRFAEQSEALEVKLRNQGLMPGDQAYKAQMDQFGRTQNDAYEQAQMGAVGQGRDEAGMLWGQQGESMDRSNALRDTQIQEYLAKRNFSLNEANSLDPTAQLKGITDALGTS